MFENFEYKDIDKFSMGYDPKLKSSDTIRLKEYIVDLITDGYSTNTISHNLSNELGFKVMYAKSLCSKAYKDYMNLIHKGTDDVKEKNIGRLNRIYRQAMEAGDRKSALTAIDQLSKLCGCYTQKVEVTSNNFELKFGDE